MLESIHIQNFAIITALQLEFEAGMTALTGETGAGKSILLDAIQLISGVRADSDSIKSGADRAEISACFNISRQSQVRHWLQQNEFASDSDCIMRRVLYANGRSKAFINGFSAPLSQLKELAQMLVDLHGQQDHQSLQKPQVQQQLLDTYLNDQPLLDSLQEKFNHWQQLQHQYAAIKSNSQEREQRTDLLQIYCQELNRLNCLDNEMDQLQKDYKRLSNAGQLLEASSLILGILYENDDTTVQSLLSYCQQTLAEQTQVDSKLENSHSLISAALIQILEARDELRSYQSSIDLDTEKLDQINQRITSIQDLARKHQVRPGELPALTQQFNQELESLQGSKHDLQAVSTARRQARDAYLLEARKLSAARIKTAASLSTQISAVMQELGMQGGQFAIEVETNAESHYRPQGIDQVRYLVSANPGQPLKPLIKVASGGELSRISLAIQVILSASSMIPTLIFDEVDSGVGGSTAEIIGQKLRQLGQQRQIFCVTHLAQVASQAHHHYRVEKHKSAQDTATEVVTLSAAERLEEVARMLGGITITEQTRAHASEMIAGHHD